LNSSGAVTAVNTFGANGLLSRRTSTGSVFYQFDPQGSVAQRLDANQNVLITFVFDAYGAQLAGGNTGEPWGYGAQVGYYTDAETGVVLCTRRYYDPIAGRWLSRDPIGYDGGINLYAYASNNPSENRDPSGCAPTPQGPSAEPLSFLPCKRLSCDELERRGYKYRSLEAAKNSINEPVTHRKTEPAKNCPGGAKGKHTTYRGNRSGVCYTVLCCECTDYEGKTKMRCKRNP